jgi:hypothetical protein
MVAGGQREAGAAGPGGSQRCQRLRAARRRVAAPAAHLPLVTTTAFMPSSRAASTDLLESPTTTQRMLGRCIWLAAYM